MSAELVGEVPADVVTVTSTAPDDPAGATAESEVAEVTLKEVAGTEPNLTAVAPVKLVPVTVTDVPPLVGPEVGVSEVTLGATGGVVAARTKIATAPATPLGDCVADACSGPETFVSYAAMSPSEVGWYVNPEVVPAEAVLVTAAYEKYNSLVALGVNLGKLTELDEPFEIPPEESTLQIVLAPPVALNSSLASPV